MKNFEKYEKEIKGALNFPDTLEPFTLMSKLAGKDILFTTDAIAWLYEDYKEPLLTDEEKEYLTTVIKPFRDRVNRIVFHLDSVAVFYKENKNVSTILRFPVKMCKANLKLGKNYSLEELGL